MAISGGEDQGDIVNYAVAGNVNFTGVLSNVTMNVTKDGGYVTISNANSTGVNLVGSDGNQLLSNLKIGTTGVADNTILATNAAHYGGAGNDYLRGGIELWAGDEEYAGTNGSTANYLPTYMWGETPTDWVGNHLAKLFTVENVAWAVNVLEPGASTKTLHGSDEAKDVFWLYHDTGDQGDTPTAITIDHFQYNTGSTFAGDTLFLYRWGDNTPSNASSTLSDGASTSHKSLWNNTNVTNAFSNGALTWGTSGDSTVTLKIDWSKFSNSGDSTNNLTGDGLNFDLTDSRTLNASTITFTNTLSATSGGKTLYEAVSGALASDSASVYTDDAEVMIRVIGVYSTDQLESGTIAATSEESAD